MASTIDSGQLGSKSFRGRLESWSLSIHQTAIYEPTSQASEFLVELLFVLLICMLLHNDARLYKRVRLSGTGGARILRPRMRSGLGMNAFLRRLNLWGLQWCRRLLQLTITFKINNENNFICGGRLGWLRRFRRSLGLGLFQAWLL